MRNRTLALLLGATLVFGGAACSDDDDSEETELEDVDSGDSESEESESEESESEDSGDSESGNADVEAFCDAVDEFVEQTQETLADPTSGNTADIQALAQELTEQASTLSADALSLSQDEIDRLNECTANIAEGLTSGG